MITIFSKEGCPKCRVLKMKLEQKGIQYEDRHDVEKLQELGFKSLPILDVDGSMMKFEDAVKYVNGL